MLAIVLILLALYPAASQAQPSASERMAARLRQIASEARDIYTTVGSGGSFGASSLQQEIGLGRADTLLFVEVTWPTTGQKQRFSNLAMDQIVHIREGDAEPIPIHLNRVSLSSSVH